MCLRSATMHQRIQARLHIRMSMAAVCTLPAAMQVPMHQIRASLTAFVFFFNMYVYHLNRCEARTRGLGMNHVWNFQFSLLSGIFSDLPWGCNICSAKDSQTAAAFRTAGGSRGHGRHCPTDLAALFFFLCPGGGYYFQIVPLYIYIYVYIYIYIHTYIHTYIHI